VSLFHIVLFVMSFIFSFGFFPIEYVEILFFIFYCTAVRFEQHIVLFLFYQIFSFSLNKYDPVQGFYFCILTKIWCFDL